MLTAQRLETTTQMNSIKREMDSILKCQGCVNVKEKVEYLEKNESLLSSKLSEYNKGRETLKACKVTLLDKHPGFFPSFRSGMAQIVNSRKAININGTSIHSVIKLESTLPDGLFASTTTPIEINSGEYRYYLLPEVILAFNMQYQFITAIEPRALSVRCNEREKGVTMVRGARFGDWTHYDTLIASDSIKVSEGIIRSSWLHTRKDGGPDQRYRNNPITQTRTDTYRHGEVVIILGRYKTAFSISAGDVSAKIRAAVYNYTRLKHELNATPSLLRLLMSSSKKTENALALSERYESINNNTFCKIG